MPLILMRFIQCRVSYPYVIQRLKTISRLVGLKVKINKFRQRLTSLFYRIPMQIQFRYIVKMTTLHFVHHFLGYATIQCRVSYPYVIQRLKTISRLVGLRVKFQIYRAPLQGIGISL
jgi:hypothetical protein